MVDINSVINAETSHAVWASAGIIAEVESGYQGISRVVNWHSEVNGA